MHWIAPSEKDATAATLEKRLWASADQYRANSGLKAQAYSGGRPPGLLGLIFLRFAEVRFGAQRAKLSVHPRPPEGRGTGDEGTPFVSRRGARVEEPAAYHAEGIPYLPAEAQFGYLLDRPEATEPHHGRNG